MDMKYKKFKYTYIGIEIANLHINARSNRRWLTKLNASSSIKQVYVTGFTKRYLSHTKFDPFMNFKILVLAYNCLI